uniref:Uncharacterized protein n=1 Tax=viral metagenome TaxID=1070528 RepID=A0A6M3XVS2_9ZZZZ
MRPFNKVQKEITKADDKEHLLALERCVPLAKKVLAILVEEGAEMGDIKESPESHMKSAELIMQAFLDANVRWADRHFIFQLAMQPVEMVKNLVLNSLGETFNVGSGVLWGVDDMMDLTVGRIDEVLKGLKEKK